MSEEDLSPARLSKVEAEVVLMILERYKPDGLSQNFDDAVVRVMKKLHYATNAVPIFAEPKQDHISSYCDLPSRGY